MQNGLLPTQAFTPVSISYRHSPDLKRGAEARFIATPLQVNNCSIILFLLTHITLLGYTVFLLTLLP